MTLALWLLFLLIAIILVLAFGKDFLGFLENQDKLNERVKKLEKERE